MHVTNRFKLAECKSLMMITLQGSFDLIRINKRTESLRQNESLSVIPLTDAVTPGAR